MVTIGELLVGFSHHVRHRPSGRDRLRHRGLGRGDGFRGSSSKLKSFQACRQANARSLSLAFRNTRPPKPGKEGKQLLITIGADTPLWQTDIYMAIFGIGLGLNMQSLVLAMQNAVPAKDMGVASAASTFFRSVGGTLGTAIFLSILFSLAGTEIARQYAKAATSPGYLAAAKAHPGQVASLHQNLAGGLDDTSFLNGLAKPLVHPFFVGFSTAGDVVFAITAILLLAAVVLSACLKEVPLRRVSGNQARAAAENRAGAPEGDAALHGAPPVNSAAAAPADDH